MIGLDRIIAAQKKKEAEAVPVGKAPPLPAPDDAPPPSLGRGQPPPAGVHRHVHHCTAVSQSVALATGACPLGHGLILGLSSEVRLRSKSEGTPQALCWAMVNGGLGANLGGGGQACFKF